MSTRCQIGIYENTTDPISKPHTLLYRHCDGYPEGVLNDIKEFTSNFIKERGFDTEYLGARLLVYLISQHTKDLPSKKKPFGGYLSYGICTQDGFHGDLSYFYAIYPDRIETYKTNSEDPNEWEKI